MVLRSGDLMAAVEVDRIIGNQEVVAKPYGPQMARVPGLAGLTVLADGTITLLLNPINLVLSQKPRLHAVRSRWRCPQSLLRHHHWRRSWRRLWPCCRGNSGSGSPSAGARITGHSRSCGCAGASTGRATNACGRGGTVAAVPVAAAAAPVAPVYVPPPVVAPAEPRVPMVLVVDDSLTVRKITTRLLSSVRGYRALTAKDGLDALQVLADNNPDVILLDIEMPRMDGFEFTKTLKADNRQSDIPIIMITSRTAEKHRSHAMELGVNEYLGKPYQDDQLLALIAKYAGKPA